MKSDKVAHVVQGLRAGFHLGFNYSTSLKSATGNMASALLNPQVVENYLQSDRQGGGPLSSAPPPPPPVLHVSRLGVIPKPGKYPGPV